MLAVVAVVVWLWQTDRRRTAPERRRWPTGVRLPVGARRPRSHSWWATVILLIVVERRSVASFAFAHVHVSMLSEVCPPRGCALPSWISVAGALAASLAALGLYQWLAKAPIATTARGRTIAIVTVAAATLLLVGGSASSVAGHAVAGLAPTANGWSASVGLLVAFQAFFAILVTVLAGFLIVRIGCGRVDPRACATQDNVLLLARYGAIQGILAVLLVQALPTVMTWRFE